MEDHSWSSGINMQNGSIINYKPTYVNINSTFVIDSRQRNISQIILPMNLTHDRSIQINTTLNENKFYESILNEAEKAICYHQNINENSKPRKEIRYIETQYLKAPEKNLPNYKYYTSFLHYDCHTHGQSMILRRKLVKECEGSSVHSSQQLKHSSNSVQNYIYDWEWQPVQHGSKLSVNDNVQPLLSTISSLYKDGGMHRHKSQIEICAQKSDVIYRTEHFHQVVEHADNSGVKTEILVTV